jgi:purine-binding chemotaxis protein CheW
MSEGLLQSGRDHIELVSVAVGDSLFAIDIMSVREIRGWSASTPIPHSPPHVLGMINLRGTILPVADLGELLGLPGIEVKASSVVVVAQVGGEQLGLLVDAVCDILTVTDEALRPTPEVSGRSRDLVVGMITTDAGIVSVLKLDKLIPETLRDAA